MRKAGRIAVRVVAAVAVIIGGVLLYLSSGPGEGFLRGLAAGQLQEALDANVSIERLETNIFSRVEVDGVLVEPLDDVTSAKRSPIDLLRIDHLRVRYSLFTLIIGGLEFDSVIVAGAQVAIRSDSLPAPKIPPDTSPDTSRTSIVDESGRFVPLTFPT
jgi:hypothetical protein